MILSNLINKKLILASQSPRRKQLLQGLGIDFSVFVKENIDEVFDANIPTGKVAEFLAKKKADSYQDIITENTIIITADTVVVHNNTILNKPKDKQDAINMLKSLSDNKHEVITGVCIKSAYKAVLFSSSSLVYFKNLTDNEIDYYIEKYKPYDKAGAYGIQEWIGYIGIKRIEGSYFNIMGLPVDLIYNELNQF